MSLVNPLGATLRAKLAQVLMLPPIFLRLVRVTRLVVSSVTAPPLMASMGRLPRVPTRVPVVPISGLYRTWILCGTTSKFLLFKETLRTLMS